MNKTEIYGEIISTGMIPLFYYGDKEKALEVVKAVYIGGCRLLEFTNRGDKALEVFEHLLISRESEYPEMVIGVGSVIEVKTATEYIEKGADFIVGPNFDEETADLCNKMDIAYIPGASTPSEIVRASRSGSKIIKIFPASTLGGPEFIKAVLGPMRWLNLMPTGGVTTEKDNIIKWFKAGVVCVGMGSKLINSKVIEEGNYQNISDSVAGVLKIIKDVRNEL